jgi:hypothetical protein
MKKSKFTGEQIAFALRQTEVGTPVVEDENQRKRLVADLSLDKAMLQEL